MFGHGDTRGKLIENIDKIYRVLAALDQVGLGYLKLGQSAPTLSGGECQRLKLATELSTRDSGKTLYVLDEPTTGLHLSDVKRLIEVLQSLVDRGNTVLVIEHHLDLLKCCDWLIDMGPEGGAAGGHILFAGSPRQLAEAPDNATGQWLKKRLEPMHEKA
ncbi:MAG: ATP-binding cassette domain-containing protein [Pirellulales bacterium]